MNAVLHDLRQAVRTLAKNRGYTSAALLVLALGLGGVTALFSTFHAVMIQPLPYASPDRLVMGRATFDGHVNPMVAGPDYLDYRDKTRSFAALEAFLFRTFEVTLVAGGRAERTSAQIATPGLLPALGVQMAVGRPFTTEEGRDGAPAVVILSHPCWQRHFASRQDVAGLSLVIDGAPREVVGVTPAGFRFDGDVDVWLPLRPQNLGPRKYNNWLILGRLKDGASVASAQADVNLVAAQLAKTYPDTNAHKALLLTPLQGAFAEQYRSSLGLLGAGAAGILAIAWANAAGLLLARGAGRRGELAVRAAMGASGWRLMRLLLIESLVLAGAAGAAGGVLAIWMQQGLLRLLPMDALLLRETGLSAPVLLFVAVTTIVTGLGFGLLPAWRTRRVDLLRDLRTSGRGALRQGVRLRSGLVAGQVAVSFVLLVMAGLLGRSYLALHRSDPGFDHRKLLTAEVPLPQAGYPEEGRSAFFATLLEQVRSLPGVVSATAASQLPMRDPLNNVSIYAADNPPTAPDDVGDGYQRVLWPGYFATMRIPLLAGRDLQPSDHARSRRVVVISRRLAQALFPNRDPLGRAVVIDGARETPWDVVGVVGDVKQDDLWQEAGSRGTFYRAFGQQSQLTMRLAVRTSGDPLALVPSMSNLLGRMDPDVPLSGARTMEAILASSTVSERALCVYLAAFSLLAVTLAAVGLYGLLAYVVAQRQREIGIRVALGAQASDVSRPIMLDALGLAAIGLAVGAPSAFALARLFSARLYGVTPFDAGSLLVAAILLLVVAALAAGLPARRAAAVDPMVALRCE